MSDIEVEKDYARKQYRTNKAYPEFIRTITQKSIWNNITSDSRHLAEFSGFEFDSRDPLARAYAMFLKQSEMKKPYRSDSYQDMEQDLYPNDPDGPVRDTIDPFNYDPVFVGGGGEDGSPGTGSALFDLNVSGGWCDDRTETILCTTTQPCYFIQITYTSSAGVTINGTTGVSIPGLNSFELELFVPAGYSGMVTLEAIMVTFDGISGDSNDNVFESRTCCDCDTHPYLWASSNPSTIDADDSIVIEVEGSCNLGAWGWEFTNDAASNGFSFGSINTSIPSNTLHTDPGACGGASIKVTDIDGCETTGSVRCTASGEWVLKLSCNPCGDLDTCILSGDPDVSVWQSNNHWLLEKTLGSQKQSNIGWFSCGCGTPGGIDTQSECKEWLDSHCDHTSRCQSAPCSANHCDPETNWSQCLEHPPTMHTSSCNPAEQVQVDCIQQNPSYYPGDCEYGAIGPYWSGTSISNWCEYNQKYYEWECP